MNNTVGRLIFFFLSMGPILFYWVCYLLFNWDFHFNYGLVIYFTLSGTYFYIMFYNCCLDWDFFVTKETFFFKRLNDEKHIPKSLKYSISNISILSAYFDVFSIKFENGEKFHFRYNIGRTPLFTSDSKTIQKIEASINTP